MRDLILGLQLFYYRYIRHYWPRTFRHVGKITDTVYKGVWFGNTKYLTRPRHEIDKYGDNGLGGFVIPLRKRTLIIVRF